MPRNRTVLVWQLPRIIEVLRKPQPLATNVMTILTDSQGNHSTHTGTTYQRPNKQIEITSQEGSSIGLKTS